MDSFPFSAEEWDKVSEAARAVTNATLVDDQVLEASQFIELQTVLDELRARHGEHPTLIETEADFENDVSRRRDMYRAAVQLAEAHALPTLSIRISLARLLLEDFGDSQSAAKELEACRHELATNGHDWDRKEWSDLLDLCQR
ncbi:MAG TPA: hypothetical protein PK867_25090 [Pirellulales bacterium]|nr:hypothetical protein [Pirellulales bacterium]